MMQAGEINLVSVFGLDEALPPFELMDGELIFRRSGVDVTIDLPLSGITVPFGIGNVSVRALNSVLGPVNLEPFSDGFTGEFESFVGSFNANDSWRLRAVFEQSLGDFAGQFLNDANIEVGGVLGGMDLRDSRNVNVDVGFLTGQNEFDNVENASVSAESIIFANLLGEGVRGLELEANFIFASSINVLDSSGVHLKIEETAFSEFNFDHVERSSLVVDQGDVEVSLHEIGSFVFRSGDGHDRLSIREGEQIAAFMGDGNDRVDVEESEEGILNTGDGEDEVAVYGNADKFVFLLGEGRDRFDLSGWRKGDIVTDWNPQEDVGEVGFGRFSLDLGLVFASAENGLADLGPNRSIEFLGWNEDMTPDGFADDLFKG